jgi:hypothetical protein
MSNLKLLYFNVCTWEYDFIVNDILHNISFDVELFNKDNLISFKNRNDLTSNCLIVINSQIDINLIIEVIKIIKPIGIFYLSDEFGNKSQNILLLENYTKLLFYNYNHKNYIYSNLKSYQLPLGYCTNFLKKIPSKDVIRKKINERNYNCSFIGTIKSDREEMIRIFTNYISKINIIKVNTIWNIDALEYSPEKCFNIYNDSIFVLSGRGNSSLDCFRIYETIVSGAIPVVVGNINEINITFNYDNDIPPIIYEETWDKAAIKCNELLHNLEKLEEIQNNIILWWNKKIDFIKYKIQNEINK